MGAIDEQRTPEEEADERAVDRAAEMTDECLSRIEKGLDAALAAAKAGGPPIGPRIGDAVLNLVAGVVAEVDESDLWALDAAVGFNGIFDFRECDPDLLNDNLNAAYLGQLRQWVTYSLANYVADYLDEHPDLLTETPAVGSRPRLSPFAEPSTPPVQPVIGSDAPDLTAD